MKNILILGSSGFVGKSFNEHLNKFYFRKIKSITLVQRSRPNKDFQISRFKIKTNLILKDFKKIKRLPKCDTIIYCIRSKNQKIDIEIFNHFVNLIKNKQKIKIIFLSSGAIYANNSLKNKIKETQKIDINKINLLKGYKKNYAKQKLLLEKKFYDLSKLGFQITVARCFTLFGENILSTNFFISKLLNSMKSKKKFYLMPNLQHIYRSYMHAYDMNEWFISILKKNNKFKVYNIGSEQSINLNDLARQICKKFRKKIIIKKTTLKKEIDYYIPSSAKIRKELKVKTKFDLNAIISNLDQ